MHVSVIVSVLFLLASITKSESFQRPLRSNVVHSQVPVNAIRGTRALRMQTGNNVAGNSKKEAQFSHIINMRGGAIPKLANMTPTSFFDYTFLVLAAVAGSLKIVQSKLGSVNKTAEEKPAAVKSLQARFLVVFWLMRMADWMQGPYFYELYSSKIIGGVPVTMDMVSKLFLIGFASTGVFGPYIGRLVDSVGRKAGTLAFAALYSVSALSTLSSSLTVLMLGRLAGGLGTSLLFSAPEAWFAGEFFKSGFDPKWLGQTFGWAYAVDSLVAISAGQLASVAASRKGPSGPFVVSLVFLALGSVIASLKWKENTAAPSTPATSDDSSPAEKQKTSGINEALHIMKNDKKIMLVGAIQALFEGAMYIFVLQWAPAVKSLIAKSALFAGSSNMAVPFGKIFSCFMVACLMGSTIFAFDSNRNKPIEKTASDMLLTATAAMFAAGYGIINGHFAALLASFFAFELCVGVYFPTIGTLRSKYIPDSHRSIIMNLFGIPLNLIVVSVFLSISRLGIKGALGISAGALALATACSFGLVLSNKEQKTPVPDPTPAPTADPTLAPA